MNAQQETETNEESLIKREQRGERFHAILKRHQIPTHGAQTIVAKAIGVSEATVAAWMRGSLPRDPEMLIRFSDEYDVDLYWWVNGTARPRDSLDGEKLVRHAAYLRDYIDKRGLMVSHEQRALMLAKIYNQPEIADEYLDEMAPLFASRKPV